MSMIYHPKKGITPYSPLPGVYIPDFPYFF